jgi:hypothetical protein
MVSSIDGGLTPYNYFGNPMPEGLTPAPGHSDRFQTVLAGQGLTTQVPDNPPGYNQQWNFNVQRQLPGGIFLDVAYAGAKGTHLPFVGLQKDQLTYENMKLGPTVLNTLVDNPFYGQVTSGTLAAAKITQGQLLRPFPQYNGITVSGAAAGWSRYNSLQVKVQKQFAGGQTILVAYTNAKLMNNTGGITNWLDTAGGAKGGVGGTQDYYNYDESSVSTFDVPQRLVASFVLDLPFGQGKKYFSGVHPVVSKLISGWGVNGIVTAQTGFPLHITSVTNTTYSYGGGQRPNYNPNGSGCAVGAELRGRPQNRINKWFNTACFSQPAVSTFGNLSRELDHLRADGIQNIDFAVFKTTTFGPDNKLGLQFRAEFLNMFNHPQFSFPGQTFGVASTFGVVSSQANLPRLVQLALRFTF